MEFHLSCLKNYLIKNIDNGHTTVFMLRYCDLIFAFECFYVCVFVVTKENFVQPQVLSVYYSLTTDFKTRLDLNLMLLAMFKETNNMWLSGMSQTQTH